MQWSGAAVIAMCVLIGSCEQHRQDVIIGDQDRAAHRLFEPIVRSARSCDNDDPRRAPMHEFVELSLQVNASGAPRILSMRSLYGDRAVPARCRALINAAMEQWRYEPFEDASGPMVVRFAETIAIYPLERWHAPRVEFPATYDLETARVVLERGGCLGRCPVYRIELRGDGTSQYDGTAFVEVTGRRDGAIDPDEFATLLDSFREADFYSLLEVYEAPITDHPYYLVTLELNGRAYTVTDYVGEYVGMPSIVKVLERRIDEVGRTSQWTGRD